MTLYMRDKENIKLGEITLIVSQVRTKLAKKKSVETIADEVECNVIYVKNIILLIEQNPDWDDEDIASEIMYDEEWSH